MRYLDWEFIRLLFFLNAFKNMVSDMVGFDTWIWVLIRNEMDFFLPTHFFTKVLYFDTEWHGMNVSNRMKRLFVHLGISSKPWNIFHYPCIGCKKVKLSSTNIRKNQHGHFLVHNNQFSSNPLTQGLDLRPTDRIRLFIVIQRSDLCHKIISVDGLRVTDLTWEHDNVFQSSQRLKTVLEVRIQVGFVKKFRFF